MKRMIGLEDWYTEGFPPSRIPPCGAALTVLEGVAEPMVLVTIRVTVAATGVAMVNTHTKVLENTKWKRRLLEGQTKLSKLTDSTKHKDCEQREKKGRFHNRNFIGE